MDKAGIGFAMASSDIIRSKLMKDVMKAKKL